MAQQKKQSTPAEWEGAFAAFSTTLKRMGERTDFLYLFLGIYALVSIISTITHDERSSYSKNHTGWEGLVAIIFILPLMNYGLSIAVNKKKTLSELFQFDLFKFLSLIATSIITAIIVGISFLLLIVPVIWALGWFALGNYAVVDKNLGPIEALKESKRISKDHIGKVWGIVGVYILIAIAAGIISIIPYVGPVATGFAGVWSVCTYALLYEWLQAQPVKKEST